MTAGHPLARAEAETGRLEEEARREKNWKRWGPYLPERQWGTVREDYSPDGESWRSFTHDQARSRAYRWGEDGLLGLTDRQCRLCFAVALWNGKDPILKERLFGLAGPEGNHGEDVKECYFYLDSTPTHSYMKALYRYPQQAFPYARLVEENARRGRDEPEYELADTGIFDDGRVFDIIVEYAKAAPDDILIRITAANRGGKAAAVHLLPTLWFRNSWSWGCAHEGCEVKPHIESAGDGGVRTWHATLGRFRFHAESLPGGGPDLLFTDNETNVGIFGGEGGNPHAKDAFHDYLVRGRTEAVNARRTGTKVAAHYPLEIPPGGEVTVRCRLFPEEAAPRKIFGRAFERTFTDRIAEADAFYDARIPAGATEDERAVIRQAYAGLLWTKQFYHYIILDWLNGDADQPPPPESRKTGRNSDWKHLYSRDVLSVPDSWEYPWFAAWDLAFHMLPFSRIDPHFSKQQLVLLLREWYMHPNGQLPAYEYAFGDVNPPVHAWAAWRVYKMTGGRDGRDRRFLASVFQKLLLNFTWWVNRKDEEGKNLFAGGFLGLDNISLFDRSRPSGGGRLEQADGTAWMAFYCATMLSMAIELARHDPVYEDLASKFLEHFVRISDAMNTLGGSGLWDEEDGFYYDRLHTLAGTEPLRIRSMVGLIPIIACEVLEDGVIESLPGFAKRTRWFLDNRKDLSRHIAYLERGEGRRLLAIPSKQRLVRVLGRMLDESEFLSPHGIRSLSRRHLDHPFIARVDGEEHRVGYVPGESDSGLFGGNSNWRGPVWFPVNHLIIEALERYHHFYGDELRVDCPTGSGRKMTLREVAGELDRRLASLFLPDDRGGRPFQGNDRALWDRPGWKEMILFHEYFDGDTGRGLGASHQTGWTALVALCLEDTIRARRTRPRPG